MRHSDEVIHKNVDVCDWVPKLEERGPVFGWRPSDVIGTAYRLAPDEDQDRLRSAVIDAMTRGDVGVTVRLRAGQQVVVVVDGNGSWGDFTLAVTRSAALAQAPASERSSGCRPWLTPRAIACCSCWSGRS